MCLISLQNTKLQVYGDNNHTQKQKKLTQAKQAMLLLAGWMGGGGR